MLAARGGLDGPQAMGTTATPCRHVEVEPVERVMWCVCVVEDVLMMMLMPSDLQAEECAGLVLRASGRAVDGERGGRREEGEQLSVERAYSPERLLAVRHNSWHHLDIDHSPAASQGWAICMHAHGPTSLSTGAVPSSSSSSSPCLASFSVSSWPAVLLPCSLLDAAL